MGRRISIIALALGLTIIANANSMPVLRDLGCIDHISSRNLVKDCVDGETEMMMDSEINRRQLAQRRYISYDALKQDSVPCNQRGSSYYNCKKMGQANPYRRGCSAITHCKRYTN